VTVDSSNAEQAAAWNGDDGRDWTDNEEKYNTAVRGHTQVLFDRAPIGDRANVLDIGCGCGETTRLAAQRALRGSAFGVDISEPMIARAADRARAKSIANVAFAQGDAQVYRFRPGAYDVAVSRYGAMFFGDPDAAFRNIGTAVRAGGSLTILTWQSLDRNPWMQAIRNALAAGRDLPTPPPGGCGPFSLADVDLTTSLLTQAGFENVELMDVREPLYLGDSADVAFDFIRRQGICRGLLQGLDQDARDRALGELRNVFVGFETADGVMMESGSWLVSATRQ
jgi:SAM-dependent methyltransferase